MAATWRDALAGERLLVSGFGKWGGGIYDLTSGTPEALDDLATSGITVGGGRVWRVLRAPGEQTSTCELLSYDAHGLRSYQRYDEIRDPHDVHWHDGAPYVTSSWDDAVWRIAGPRPSMVWRGGSVPDGWHVNSLITVAGALHACAFGRFDRHKGWKASERKDTGFVVDLSSGREVLTGLAHPHTPRHREDSWYVCESTAGTLTELDQAGRVRRRAAVRRFTRGLALVGGWALVGGNAHRDHDDDRAEVVVVDLGSFEVVERIPMPCLEVYDVLVVPRLLAHGVGVGFGANPARAVEQHRSRHRPSDRNPAPAQVTLQLAAPRTAELMASLGRPIDSAEARRCGVRGELPSELVAGTVTSVRLDVFNRSGRPLGSVLPRPVKVGARWLRRGAGDEAARRQPIANPRLPLPRLVPAGCRTGVDILLEVPDAPGRYELRVALHQQGVGWFGARAQAEVTVVAGPGETPSRPSAAPCDVRADTRTGVTAPTSV